MHSAVVLSAPVLSLVWFTTKRCRLFTPALLCALRVILLLLYCSEAAGRDMDPNKIDVVENGAIVKVFLLEGSLPWNAGPDILDSAGPFWESYGA